MKFHEEHEGYRTLGIEEIVVMLRLSKAEITSGNARDYNQAGHPSIDDMLELKEAGIKANSVKTVGELGFSTDTETLNRLFEKFKGFEFGWGMGSLRQYAEAGFTDAETVLEFYHQDEFGAQRVKPEFAVFLAEHGLKGDKEAMLNVSEAIGYDTMQNLARRIAFRLSGEELSYIEARHLGVQSNSFDFEHADGLRIKFAEQMPATELVLLAQYDLGEEEAEESHPIRKAIGFAYAIKSKLKEPDERIDEEIKRLDDRSYECLGKIATLREGKLMEAYTILREQGEDAFKAKYTPNEGWVDNGKGGLNYDPKIACQLQQERLKRERSMGLE